MIVMVLIMTWRDSVLWIYVTQWCHGKKKRIFHLHMFYFEEYSKIEKNDKMLMKDINGTREWFLLFKRIHGLMPGCTWWDYKRYWTLSMLILVNLIQRESFFRTTWVLIRPKKDLLSLRRPYVIFLNPDVFFQKWPWIPAHRLMNRGGESNMQEERPSNVPEDS